MPAFLARSATSLFKHSVTFLLDMGRMTYVQKVFGDLGFGKKEWGEIVQVLIKNIFLFQLGFNTPELCSGLFIL